MAANQASSSHLWVCDREGRVFILKNVGATVDAIRRSQTFSPAGSHDPSLVKWMKVEGELVRLDEVLCGYSGMVLGVSRRNSILYARKGISEIKPEGDSWSKCFCDATTVVAGNQFVARCTKNGELFAASINQDVISTPVFVLSWAFVPHCTFTESLNHIAMDKRDNIYIISSTGEVYRYFGLGSQNNGKGDAERTWEVVSSPPKLRKSGFSFFGLWKTEREEVFSRVCAGSHSLWCVRKDSSELWQLVLGELQSDDDDEEKEIKTNWIPFSLPKEDSVLHCCGDKIKIDTLYCTESGSLEPDGEYVISYSLLKDNAGKLEFSNPSGCTLPWKSIAVCHVQLSRLTATSIYPSLPRMDLDLCCETGDCDYCRNADKENKMFVSEHQIRSELASSSSILRGGGEGSSEPEMRPIGWSEGQAMPTDRHLVGRKRAREDLHEEQYHTSFAYQSKRVRFFEGDRHFFLEGIDVGVRKEHPNQRYLQQFTPPSEIVLPISTSEVESEFDYSFELEGQVLQDSYL